MDVLVEEIEQKRKSLAEITKKVRSVRPISLHTPAPRQFWTHCLRECLLPCSQSTRSSFSLVDCLSVGVDRMQRNFEPMRSKWKHARKVN